MTGPMDAPPFYVMSTAVQTHHLRDDPGGALIPHRKQTRVFIKPWHSRGAVPLVGGRSTHRRHNVGGEPSFCERRILGSDQESGYCAIKI